MFLWWRRFRNLDKVQVLAEELAQLSRDYRDLQPVRDHLDRESIRRAGAEAIAAERLRTIDRMEAENTRLNAINERILSERLKSLDAINTRLMEPRVEAPPPDIRQYREALEKAATEAGHKRTSQMVEEARKLHRTMDMAILDKFYSRSGKTATPRAPEGPIVVPTPDPIPAEDITA